MLSFAISLHIKYYYLFLLVPCMPTMQMYRLRDKARTDFQTNTALEQNYRTFDFLWNINYNTFSINEVTSNFQDVGQFTQQSRGRKSFRTRCPANDIFADLEVSTSSAVHMYCYSSIYIVWLNLLFGAVICTYREFGGFRPCNSMIVTSPS